MNEEFLVRTFVAAAVGVAFGSLGRRARELDGMETVRKREIGRMLLVEAMLLPSGAGFAGGAVLYLELHWLVSILFGMAAGLGGFATSDLVVQIFKGLALNLAETIKNNLGQK